MAKNNIEFNEEAIKSLYNLAGKDSQKLALWFKKVKQDISVELIESIIKNNKENKEAKNENSTKP